MAPKVIKLGKRDDVASVIKRLKALKDREVIFELEPGSALLGSSNSLRLIKKTGEVLGKNVKIETTDETGRMLARKAGVLAGEVEAKNLKPGSRVGGNLKSGFDSSASRNGRFSDIMRPNRGTGDMTKKVVPSGVSPKFTSEAPKVLERPVSLGQSSRMEFDLGSSSSKFSKIFIFCLVVLVVAVFGLAVLLPKADVSVQARSEPITRDLEIMVDKAVLAVDTNSLRVPGMVVSKEIQQTNSFATTGTRASGSKAAGVVTIYNFTVNTLTLRASTTTLLANGKNYFFTKDVPGIKPNGSPNTGITITAENGGADYNLPADTKFQIINAALGSQNVYAQNPQALAGGSTGAVTKVMSQQDLDNATESLLAGVIAQAEDDLTQEFGAKIKLLDTGVKKEILAKTANKDVGAATDSFDMTLIARVSGLAFKEDNVTAVVVAKISEVLSKDKYLLPSGKNQFDAKFKSVDTVAGRGVLEVHFETTAAYKVDGESLQKLLAGKNESEIKEILLSKPEIENIEVKFWPEWFVHKAPKFNGKIKITTVVAES